MVFIQQMHVRGTNKKNISFTQKNKITSPGLIYKSQSLGVRTTVGMRDDKFNIFLLYKIKNLRDEKVHRT